MPTELNSTPIEVTRAIVEKTPNAFLGLVVALGLVTTLSAQNIGWEGETGVFVTPLAYVVGSPANGISLPYVGFHYMNGGAVLGDFFETSLTAGAFGRTEFGFTRTFHTLGGTPNLSNLWPDGFNIIHAKVNVVSENAGKHKWIPAISLGGMARIADHDAGGALLHKSTKNGDIYCVASKTIPSGSRLSMIFTGGVRATNAELWGLGGNAPTWTGRAFGSGAFVVKLPGRARMAFASEVEQQPLHPAGFPDLRIPTTLTYAVRYYPATEHRLAIDFGMAQIAGKVAPGVNLEARARFGMQVTYGF